MADFETLIEASPEHQTEQILGENVLRMVDKLEFIPDCQAQWSFELDDIEYEVTVKRK